MILSKYTKFLLFILPICLFTGCGSRQDLQQDEAKKEVVYDAAQDAGDEAEPEEITYAAQNEKYGLALPNAEAFGDILQDFIYWDYATTIEKNTDEAYSIINILEDADAALNIVNVPDPDNPETNLKIHLYYREGNVEEMDEAESNIYNVIVTFPEEKELSYFSFLYNARGLSSDYDYGYSDWFEDDLLDDDIDDISSQKLEENPYFKKDYTYLGEASLTINKAEAEKYEVTDKFPTGEKEEILSAIRKAIKKEYKKENNQMIYIRDFLPGDMSLSGRQVNLDITSKHDMPLFWIRSSICYSGPKLEKFEGINWYTHYSTGYSGAGGPYDPTLKKVKKWAQEENEDVDASKCILAYRIENGELIDLKSGNE